MGPNQDPAKKNEFESALFSAVFPDVLKDPKHSTTSRNKHVIHMIESLLTHWSWQASLNLLEVNPTGISSKLGPPMLCMV